MTVLAIGSQKGGVGKTTTVVYFSAALAALVGPGKVALVDRDETQNLTKMFQKWPSRRPPGVDLVSPPVGMEIEEWLEQPPPPGYDYVIVDTPPREKIAKYLHYVDLLVAPCPPDLQAVTMLADYLQAVVEQCHGLPQLRLIAVLPTMVDRRVKVHKILLAKMHDTAAEAIVNPTVLPMIRRLNEIAGWDFSSREYDAAAREVFNHVDFRPAVPAAQ